MLNIIIRVDYNVVVLKKRTKLVENIEIIEKGTWNEETVLEFSESGNSSQSVENEGSVKVEVTTINNIVGMIRLYLSRWMLKAANWSL